jgi:S-adenosylmethionine:tRNA ribosyltransferase-isomerase
VGSTSLRCLESLPADYWNDGGSYEGRTSLFVRPPFMFQRVDGLITNFHWPRSSLLVMVEAFLRFKGLSSWRDVYDEALRERYRLFSLGDGMLIL